MSDGPPLHATVLVVDGDAEIRLLASSSLRNLGFLVSEASNGDEGIAAASRLRPDVILLALSDIDGLEVCRALRAAPGTSNSPIVILSSIDDISSVESAYEAGATDFSVKPTNWLLLGHRLHYLIRIAGVNEALRRSEAQLVNAQRLALLGSWEWDMQSDFLTDSEEFRRILGVEKQDSPKTLAEFLRYIHPQDRDRIVRSAHRSADEEGRFGIEYRVIRMNREHRAVSQQAQIFRDDSGRAVRLLATIRDVTQQKLDEKRLRLLAEFDAVTSLPNRRGMIDRMQLVMGLAEQHSRTLAVMILDLDGFKRVNDSLGHTEGDALLRDVGARLTRHIRKSDIAGRDMESSLGQLVSRFGGDEFVILLSEIEQPEDSVRVAQRVIDVFRTPYRIGSQDVFMTASVGIAIYPMDGAEPEVLLKHADTAMHEAKRAGGNRFRVFAESMHHKVVERLSLESGLRRALERGEFTLHYQPKASARTRLITGAEALVRWNSPELGSVAPDRFIPVCEESGLIVPLGQWVLREACRQLLEWHTTGLQGFCVAVNVSARQFNDPDFADKVFEILSGSNLDLSCLELELTESTVMANPEESRKILKRLTQMGLKLAIDDFGTGYSSLGLLKQFPIDALKIDKSLTQGVNTDPDLAAIVSAIVVMGHALHLRVVAEGVEDEEQQRFLAKIECDEIQGYLISRPVPGAEIMHVVSSGRQKVLAPEGEGKPSIASATRR